MLSKPFTDLLMIRKNSLLKIPLFAQLFEFAFYFLGSKKYKYYMILFETNAYKSKKLFVRPHKSVSFKTYLRFFLSEVLYWNLPCEGSNLSTQKLKKSFL